LNTYYHVSGLAAPTTVYLRVSPNQSATVNPAHTYRLLMGSRVSTSSNVSVVPVGNIVRINVDPYLTTQTADELDWFITLFDSSHHPVPSAETDFRWLMEGDTSYNADAAPSSG
jgi:hypothetical protein